ncbi:MAG: ABC transporter permease [Fusobacteriia bacterium 4572_132]|nr:MAG: ABC transporter permease [Fusobacteriia bacterium 4572_132]
MKKRKKKKSKLINLMYLLIWIIPFLIFFKDFLNIGDMKKVIELKTLKILWNTLYQSFLSTIIAFLISLIPTYYIARHKNKISELIESTLFIPFFFPPISTIIAFSIIYSIGIFKTLEILYTLEAIIIAHIFYNSPIFVKYIGEALRKIPKEIVEQAKLEGATNTKIFFLIELPIILPSILRAFFLVFTYCFTSFAIVLSLGNIKYSTLEVSIVRVLMSSFNFSKALGYAFIQFIMLSIINYLTTTFDEYILEENNEKDKGTPFLISLFSLIYLCFEYGIVFIGIIVSFYNFYTNRIEFTGVINIFSLEFNKKYPVLLSILNSILISTVVSLITVIFVYILLKNKTKFTNFIILSTMGISSAFLAMSLLYLNISFFVPYPILIGVGYFLIAVPIGYSFMYQHIRGFDFEIIEASQIDGANNLQSFIYIEFPLLKNIFLGSFLQIFAIVYGEFTIAYTMQMQSSFPIASVINFSLASKKMFQESGAFSALNILLIFGLFWMSKKVFKKKREY